MTRHYRTTEPMPIESVSGIRADADSEFINRSVNQAEERNRQRQREENLARLHELCGVEPPTPRGWSWSERLLGRAKSSDEPTFEERITRGKS